MENTGALEALVFLACCFFVDTPAQRSNDAWRGKEQCELGVAAACLCKAHATEAKLCIRGISLQRMLATRWPVLKLLADLQKPAAMAHESSCSGLQHPSLNWDLWLEQDGAGRQSRGRQPGRCFAQVTAYAEVAASWLQGDFEDTAGSVGCTMQALLSHKRPDSTTLRPISLWLFFLAVRIRQQFWTQLPQKQMAARWQTNGDSRFRDISRLLAGG